jgi:urease accessory protein
LTDIEPAPLVAPGSGATARLLLLVDGRLPTGGHVHSGGLESAVADGRVTGLESLGHYLEGRLWTTGRVDAALALAVAAGAPWEEAEDEAAARCPSTALRLAGRTQGRGLLRCGRQVWPGGRAGPVLQARPSGVLWPVALGLVALDAGVPALDVPLIAATAAISGPAWAAVRLLAGDPFAVAALLARLAPAVDEVAAGVRAAAHLPLADLPAHGAPVSELAAELHLTWEARLFAS